MPPKSPNRSGKSTPTRGRPGEKKDEEKLLQDEEEERLRLEQEEKARQEKEAREKLEQERRAELDTKKDKQVFETNIELGAVKLEVEQVKNDKLAHAEWNRYMKCDGKPDPTSVKEINTFISLSHEKGSPDVNIVLEDAKLILSLISELNELLEDFTPEEFEQKVDSYRQTILSLQDLLLNRYNEATLKMLKEASYEADSESGNLQKVVDGENETIMLWANLNKNPRFKLFEFENEKISFELPKVLAMADIAVRILRTKFDHYSHQCTTFLPKKKKVKDEEPIPEEPPKPEDAEEVEVKGDEENGEDAKSVVEEGRQSKQSNEPGLVIEGEKEEETKKDENEAGEKEDAVKTPDVQIEIEEDEEEILDPDVVDLRQFSPLGGVYHVDLLKTPPQPNIVRGWTLTQIIDKPLSTVKYPSDNPNTGRSSSRVASANPEGRDEGSPSKTPLEQQQPPIGLTFALPSNVMFFEEPQVASWDSSDKHWKTSGITDTNFDEENRKLLFKTQEFGTFCLMQDSHLNMPFQSWELKPKGTNSTVLTITAAIAEVEIEVKDSKCRLNAPAEDPPKELSGLYGKWMAVPKLIAAMRDAGVNVFPAEDSHKFVSIQSKEVDLERVYEQMAILSSTFAFSWSKWNNDAGSKQVIIQIAPCLIKENVPRDAVSDDDWSIFSVSDDMSYKLALSEYDEEFADVVAKGATYHCDLLHAVRETTTKDSNEKLLEQLTEKSQNANKFFIHAVATLLKASKLVSFS
uniref:axonemal 84 kDa protein isoform X1 n=1 Tax=Ciona intestinalis TaxID=7719 RepID=UPI00089DC1A3|nr:axonemal 84 kDa protein isoform X1 [Ciona intestinalis]|eukprot:XP_018669746.1 axonemal 84 kDa protein isoform X1 [Ciona intestinalis]